MTVLEKKNGFELAKLLISNKGRKEENTKLKVKYASYFSFLHLSSLQQSLHPQH